MNRKTVLSNLNWNLKFVESLSKDKTQVRPKHVDRFDDIVCGCLDILDLFESIASASSLDDWLDRKPTRRKQAYKTGITTPRIRVALELIELTVSEVSARIWQDDFCISVLPVHRIGRKLTEADVAKMREGKLAKEEDWNQAVELRRKTTVLKGRKSA